MQSRKRFDIPPNRTARADDRRVIPKESTAMTGVRFAIAALLFAASGTTFSATTACPDVIPNSYQCSQYLEKELAKDYPRLFSREGDRLAISLANGKTKTYIDIPDETNHGAGGRWFNLVRYFPEIAYALVAIQYYEGDTHLLVNLKTGEETDIVSYPVLSPDKKRIAVANVDLESGYTPNFLAVYALRSGGLVKEFYAKPEDWGAGNLRWVNDNEISFDQYRLNPGYDPKVPGKLLLETPKKLKRVAGKWTVE